MGYVTYSDPNTPIPAATQGNTFLPTDSGTSGRGYYFLPDLPTPPAASLPALVPTFLKSNLNTPGSTIILFYGTCRLPGQVIWGTGIDASSDPSVTSLATFITCFGEPADLDEPVRIQKLWANGTLFYDFDVDPSNALTVASLTPDAQAALNATCASMVYRGGDPDQLPDSLMESIVGVGNAPADRGLRCIRFQDFPLQISNNDFPSISCLFKRTDTTLVNVSTAMAFCIARYCTRVGIHSNLAGINPVGIDDQCYGVTISDQSTALDQLTRHKDIYNYQILDGSPVTIVRRDIGAGLTIDLEVNETDCKRDNGAPAITMQRKDPASLPIMVSFSYIDPDHDFDVRVQQAMHEGTQTSTTSMSVQSAFITDATTTRQLAFDILYQQRAKGLNLNFELDDIEPEVGDVINLTTNEGDIYTVLVQQQTHTKSRSAAIQSLALLTQAGTDVAGDGGHDGGSSGHLKWPEQSLSWDLIPTPDRIWGVVNGGFMITYNSTTAPARRIPGNKFFDLSAADPGALNWGGAGPVGKMFEDNTYVYWLSNNAMVISRVLKSAPSIGATVETIVIADGFFPNENSSLNYGAQLKDGKLYVAWKGTWAGASNQMKLIVVDLVAWSPTAVNAYDYSTDLSLLPAPRGFCVTDNGTIIIGASRLAGGVPPGRYYYSSVGSPGTWAFVDATINLGYATFSGNTAYFMENDGTNGVSNRKHQIAVVDCTGTPSESIISLTAQDANVVNISQGSQDNTVFPWVSDTHLFIPCNFTRSNATDQNEHRYLGRFALGTVAAAGGKFFSDFIYAERELNIENARYFGGKNYLVMYAGDYDGRLIVIGEDLSPASAVLYPPDGYPVPVNDDFAAALNINLGETKFGNLFYGSTEAGEPVPTWAPSGSGPWVNNNGHSVWYTFVAPATTTYTLSVSDPGGHANFSADVYTGSAIGSLTHVAGAGGTGASSPLTVSLSATAGVIYSISLRRDDTLFTTLSGEQAGNYTFSIT